jgi:LDH2 family malate/lactate/ureidoglycolate dehydrogenase
LEDILDSLVTSGRRQPIHYLWRPTLKDPSDDLLLEVAVAGGCDTIVTFNIRDFVGSDRFGVAVQTPHAFLTLCGDPSMSALSIRLPNSLHVRVRELAAREGISINQLVATALAEKMAD